MADHPMPSRLVVVGAGWRAEYFFRIARALPQQFEIVGVAVRRESEAERVTKEHGLYAFTDMRIVSDLAPSFVVVATPANLNSEICAELVALGQTVLLETPPGTSDEQLDAVASLEAAGARIQVAEQYQFQPLLAARLAVVASGRLGRITSAQVSVAHGYHGVALLRAALGAGIGAVEVQAHKHVSELTVGPDRSGPPEGDSTAASVQTIAVCRFGEQLGLYDWSDDQYFSWIRSLRFTVRGTRGELDGNDVRCLLADGTPVQPKLRRWDTGLEGNLEEPGHRGYILGDEWVYRNPFNTARISDDEIAVATVLQRMAAYTAGGPPVYCLEDAIHDARVASAVERSASSGSAVLVEQNNT